MGTLFLIIFFLVSVMIVGLVLLQEGKGGGLTGMSTGMDGVMGAKNPLRRMTAYLFVFFVLMAITINWYFHQRTDTSLPAGATLPEPQRVLEETTPLESNVVAPEGALRPESAPEAPAAPIRPEGEIMPAAPADEGEAKDQEEIEALRREIGDGSLRPAPESTPAAPEAASVQPPAAPAQNDAEAPAAPPAE